MKFKLWKLLRPRGKKVLLGWRFVPPHNGAAFQHALGDLRNRNVCLVSLLCVRTAVLKRLYVYSRRHTAFNYLLQHAVEAFSSSRSTAGGKADGDPNGRYEHRSAS